MLPVPRQSLSPVLAKGQRQQEGAGTPQAGETQGQHLWALDSQLTQSLTLFLLDMNFSEAAQGLCREQPALPLARR